MTASQQRTAALDIPSVVLDPGAVRAVVLDADGVMTNSRTLRTTAWQDTFDAYLAQYARVTGDPQPSSDVRSDLHRDLTGRLDEDTAAELLRATGRRIDLAAVHLGPSRENLLALLVRHQDQRFLDLLNSPGVPARSGSAGLLRALRAAGIPTAAVSTSRHCGLLLRRAGLANLVDACVDAEDALHHQLVGPTEPALYQFATKLLHCGPGQSALLVGAAGRHAAGSRGRAPGQVRPGRRGLPRRGVVDRPGAARVRTGCGRRRSRRAVGTAQRTRTRSPERGTTAVQPSSRSIRSRRVCDPSGSPWTR
ncbi:HAD family hydrolase [Kitasatospora sp. P5_F3]